MSKERGQFVSIEGSDATGKRTQHGMFAERASRSMEVVLVDFPQYGQPSAELAEAYLQGAFGNPTEFDPRAASAFYAIDRLGASPKIRAGIEAGALVLANRFSASNMAHQGAKLADRQKRSSFFDWVYQLEHEIMGIPFPDQHFVLHLPAAVAQARLELRGGVTDGHEIDPGYLRRSEATFLELADMFPDRFTVIDCMDGSRELPPTEIHEIIWENFEERRAS